MKMDEDKTWQPGPTHIGQLIPSGISEFGNFCHTSGSDRRHLKPEFVSKLTKR